MKLTKNIPTWVKCIAEQFFELDPKSYPGGLKAAIYEVHASMLLPKEAGEAMGQAFKEYARACCKASLLKAAVAAEVTINGKPAMGGYVADVDTIINPENITLL